MIRSRLRYLMASSRAPVSATALAAIVGYAVLSDLTLWRGDWKWGYNHLGQTVPVLMLITAFVAGWDSGSATGGYRALIDRVPTSTWRAAATVLLPSLAITVGTYGVGLITVAIATRSADGVIDPRAPLIICSHALMIVLAAALGGHAGRVLPAPAAAFASVTVVALLLFFHPGRGQHVFEYSGTAGPAVGSTPALPYYAANLGTLLVVSTALIIPLCTARRRRSVTAAGVTIAAATLLATSMAGPNEQYEPSRQIADRCLRGRVVVCVYPGYDALLPVAERTIGDFLERALERGVPPEAFPSRFEQYGRTPPGPDVGTLSVGEDGLRSTRFGVDDLATSLSVPLWCPAMFGDQPPTILLRRARLVRAWVGLVVGNASTDDVAVSFPAFARLTPSRQAARIVDELEQLRECDNG